MSTHTTNKSFFSPFWSRPKSQSVGGISASDFVGKNKWIKKTRPSTSTERPVIVAEPVKSKIRVWGFGQSRGHQRSRTAPPFTRFFTRSKSQSQSQPRHRPKISRPILLLAPFELPASSPKFQIDSVEGSIPLRPQRPLAPLNFSLQERSLVPLSRPASSLASTVDPVGELVEPRPRFLQLRQNIENHEVEENVKPRQFGQLDFAADEENSENELYMRISQAEDKPIFKSFISEIMNDDASDQSFYGDENSRDILDGTELFCRRFCAPKLSPSPARSITKSIQSHSARSVDHRDSISMIYSTYFHDSIVCPSPPPLPDSKSYIDKVEQEAEIHQSQHLVRKFQNESDLTNRDYGGAERPLRNQVTEGRSPNRSIVEVDPPPPKILFQHRPQLSKSVTNVSNVTDFTKSEIQDVWSELKQTLGLDTPPNEYFLKSKKTMDYFSIPISIPPVPVIPPLFTDSTMDVSARSGKLYKGFGRGVSIGKCTSSEHTVPNNNR